MTQQNTATPVRRGRGVGLAIVALIVGLGVGWYVGGTRGAAGGEKAPGAAAAGPSVVASSPEEAGKYLVTIGGCNDCHTPGFAADPSKPTQTDWLAGEALGYRGPWGTTYPSNLRLYVQNLPEAGFVSVMRMRKTNPPMPWPSMNAMSDQDLRAIYRYIKSLGPAGQATPTWVPPTREPTTPYLVFEPQAPKK